MKKFVILTITASSLVLASCSNRSYVTSSSQASYGAPKGVVGSSAGLVRNSAYQIAPSSQSFVSFDSWKASFAERARAAGASDSAIAQASPYIQYESHVVSSDRSQSEFVKPIWEYLDSAVGSRTAKGQSMAAQWGATLSAIESRYGVSRDVLMGIWGMETNFGGYMGNTNIFTAMSTLAYEGRRRDWAEKQLINALKIVERGDRPASALLGSWGGGMGNTQFIPEMYNIYAVDYDGDGQRNLWSVPDALASTANFLRNEGWTPGLPWGVEVRLPANFNYMEADYMIFKPASYWASNGVQSLSPRGLPNGELAIYLPAGANGPAFAVTRNFHAIKRYNPSDSYALAVGLVGDRAFGLPAVQTPWPRYEQPLRKSSVKIAQQRLMALGYDTGGADGVPGRSTRNAVREYQASVGMTPDGFLNNTLLARLGN